LHRHRIEAGIQAVSNGFEQGTDGPEANTGIAPVRARRFIEHGKNPSVAGSHKPHSKVKRLAIGGEALETLRNRCKTLIYKDLFLLKISSFCHTSSLTWFGGLCRQGCPQSYPQLLCTVLERISNPKRQKRPAPKSVGPPDA
jgi:hypothetical protein